MGDIIARGIANLNSHRTSPFVFNEDIGLRKWKSSLAKLKAGATQVVDVVVIGDSITEGGYAGGGASQGSPSYFYTKGYFGRVQAALTAKYGDVGTGFIPQYYANGHNYWTFDANWGDWYNAYGVTGWNKLSSVSGAVATFNFTGTGLGLVVARSGSAGTLNISIDGTAYPALTATYGTVVPAYRFETNGLMAGTHTATLTTSLTTGQQFYFIGGYPIKGTAGIRMHMCGRWGTYASQHAGTENSLQAEINVWNPTLTIIAIGANDYTQGTTISSFTSSVQTLISRAQQFGDVLILGNGLRTESGTYPQSQYFQALLQLALQNNCCYVDNYNRWGADPNFAKNTLGFISDTVHPNDYGHQDLATSLLNVLLEPSA